MGYPRYEIISGHCRLVSVLREVDYESQQVTFNPHRGLLDHG
jgi:hypothetical protein